MDVGTTSAKAAEMPQGATVAGARAAGNDVREKGMVNSDGSANRGNINAAGEGFRKEGMETVNNTIAANANAGFEAWKKGQTENGAADNPNYMGIDGATPNGGSVSGAIGITPGATLGLHQVRHLVVRHQIIQS